jgi:F0F1-type ATP synthase beta subunit
VALARGFDNLLSAELHQLARGALLRSVALAWTDGLGALRAPALLVFRALAVQVGRVALGRLLNVLGRPLDSYAALPSHDLQRATYSLARGWAADPHMGATTTTMMRTTTRVRMVMRGAEGCVSRWERDAR